MKPTTSLALTAAVAGLASLLHTAPSPAEDLERLAPRQLQMLLPTDDTTSPPAPLVPEGTNLIKELNSAIALINADLIRPMSSYSNRRVRMSRALIRMDAELHFAITDTSDSLFPFDVYQRHRRGDWQKIASGVCHPGMESLKLAMPETGVMVDPIKHPLFAAALTEHKKSTAKKSS